MKNIGIKLAAVTFLALLPLAPGAALAGKGGSAEAIDAAVRSTSVDAIIAEVERTESLICEDCLQTLTNLTADPRYPVREVAAWWFARRPAYKDMLATQFVDDLVHGDTIKVRNASDFLAASGTLGALPQLRIAQHRGGLGAEARLAIVRAAATLAHPSGNDLLATAMSDSDAGVRAAAARAWRDMRDQTSAQPVVALLHDGDANVRAQAAGTIGGLAEQAGRPALEALVVSDPDPFVRRNAAWALGQLGNAASRAALQQATSDKSGLVSGVARASLARLR
ncbi:MAG TPA: HEAT repeat domain-containing protein [Kofleriaceae bacterium]|nr:HEAT repeat domain-containing protein [Kofleriaceae bacterium]